LIFEVNRQLVDWGYTRMSAGSPMFSILSNYSELDIDWLLRRLGFVNKSVVKRSIQYIEVYWLDGFSSSFFIALDGFLNYIYSRVGKGLCDINTFKGDVRGIIERSLIEGVYDIAMSKFFTYIYSLAIKWIRGERRRSAVECPIGLNDIRVGSVEFRQHRDLFFTRCESLGVSIDRELFANNLVSNKVTPLVFSFLWLLRLGELSNAEG
jgi:hypothetical protein